MSGLERKIKSLKRYAGRALLSAFVAGAGYLTSPNEIEAEVASDSGKIAFVSDRDSNHEIYVMNSDGSGQTRLTYTPSHELHLSLSPDGTKIVFESNIDDYLNPSDNVLNFELYILDINSLNITRLTNHSGWDGTPSWSPDGTKIAFASAEPRSKAHIYTMNTDGSNLTLLTKNLEADFTPAWSPDGSKIAYESNGRIGVINADGTNQVMLRSGLNPAWSPDGSKIAFATSSQGEGNIYVMNADGTNQMEIGSGNNPTWSRDGKRIAFSSWRTNRNETEIYVMDANGSNVVELTNNEYKDISPSWGGGRIDAPPVDEPNDPPVVVEPPQQVNNPPVARIKTSKTRGTEPLEIILTSESYDPDNGDRITKHEWDFDNDGVYDAYGQNVTHVFSKGNYSVRLRVRDNQGAYATAVRNITVDPLLYHDFTLEKIMVLSENDGLPVVGDKSYITFDIKNIGDGVSPTRHIRVKVQSRGTWRNIEAVTKTRFIDFDRIKELEPGESITRTVEYVFTNEATRQIRLALMPRGSALALDGNTNNNSRIYPVDIGWNNDMYKNCFGTVMTAASASSIAELNPDLLEAANLTSETIEVFNSTSVTGLNLAENDYKSAGYSMLSSILTSVGHFAGEGFSAVKGIYKTAVNEFNSTGCSSLLIRTGEQIFNFVDERDDKVFDFLEGVAERFQEEGYTTVILGSPAILSVEDYDNNIVSVAPDGTIVETLDESIGLLLGDYKVVHFKQEPGKSYDIQLEGTDTGNLDLAVYKPDSDPLIFNNMPNEAGTISFLTINERYDNRVRIDLDNNGNIDAVIWNELTEDEFSGSDFGDFRIDEFMLQNYPNPFISNLNPTTAIPYRIIMGSGTILSVVNLAGQRVRTIFQGNREAGYYRELWDGLDDNGSPVSSGVYLYRLETNYITETKKMLLLK